MFLINKVAKWVLKFDIKSWGITFRFISFNSLRSSRLKSNGTIFSSANFIFINAKFLKKKFFLLIAINIYNLTIINI